ncbi:MAG: SRPBCC domain-containing protein [Acidobacteriota bacterium]|nr:SRPBCC domain-containing protein [Acidobacteriota bacterium]
MSDPVVTHSTFCIERHYPVSPERLFLALSDPTQRLRWTSPAASRKLHSYELDFRPGGLETTRFQYLGNSPVTGMEGARDVVFLDIQPNQRVVESYTMDINGYRMSASLATFELMAEGEGTTLRFTEQGAYFANSDGPKLRELGWSHLLEHLGAALQAAV